MSWREFIASIVGSLAWPVSAAFLVWLLRHQLKGLFDRQPTWLRAGPFEATWTNAAEDVGENVVALTAQARDAHSADDHDREVAGELAQLYELVDKAPIVAVLTGYRLLEREIARHAGADIHVSTSPPKLLRALTRTGLAGDEMLRAVNGLAIMRNLAARDDGSGLAVTPERASEYLALLERVLFALRRTKAGQT